MRNGEKNLNMKGKKDRKTVITSCNLWIKGIFHTNFQINILLNSYLIFLDYKQQAAIEGEQLKIDIMKHMLGIIQYGGFL